MPIFIKLKRRHDQYSHPDAHKPMFVDIEQIAAVGGRLPPSERGSRVFFKGSSEAQICDESAEEVMDRIMEALGMKECTGPLTKYVRLP